MKPDRFTVILVRPQNADNIGLTARCMRNTGFRRLRIVGMSSLPEQSYRTAVHAHNILANTIFFEDFSAAAADLDIILAAVSRTRKHYIRFSLDEVVHRMEQYPPEVSFGLAFGNERTGLTNEELHQANFLFSLPQASIQPSYNLASAVLLTLYAFFSRRVEPLKSPSWARPLSQREQQENISLILKKLEAKGFIHKTNKNHVTDMIYSLFGRIVLTEKDRKLLLALFSKGINFKNQPEIVDVENKSKNLTRKRRKNEQ
ncbi:MAG: hypothetical protein JXB26_12695 [Candidatus Aminicenantes bacterium]|nr:hypothetical protein [Candidatus Aminicenantes bacterium]